MTVTLAQTDDSLQDTCGNSVSVSLSGVTAGNLVVIAAEGEAWGCGNNTAGILSVTGGGGSWTIGTYNVAGDGSSGEPMCHFAWCLSETAGDKTWTVNFGDDITARTVKVYEFNDDQGGTWTMEAEGATAEGDSSNPTSDNVNAPDCDIVLGACGWWTGSGTWIDFNVDGIDADAWYSPQDYQASWYSIVSGSGINNGNVDCTRSAGSTYWTCTAICFQAASAAPTGIELLRRRIEGY